MITEILTERFGNALLDARKADQESVTVSKGVLIEVLTFLKNSSDGPFDVLLDLCGVDYLKMGRIPRFEAVYHLYSLKSHRRLRVKCPLNENDLSLPSVTGLWGAADWFEREAYDMFGIYFKGHPKLKRLLLWDGFVGHPLRKDYPLDKRQPLPKMADIV